jgi:hypothetical protein
MILRPQYDKAGSFAGFSALLGGEWSAPQRYKDLMRAIADSGSEVLYKGDRRARNYHRRTKDVLSSATVQAFAAREQDRRLIQVPKL